MIAPALRRMARPVGDLTPHPRNARQGDVGAISQSLERFGQVRPIVVQKATGYVVAGNHVLAAARALGWPKVAAVEVDLSDQEAIAYLVADNRIADLGTYDDRGIADLLADLSEWSGGLDGTGYDAEDYGRLLDDLARDEGTQSGVDPDEIPEPPTDPASKPGEVYELGPHRLICADALDPDTYPALLGDEQAQMVMTSPPYWVGKEYEREHTWDGVQAFIREAAARMAAVTDPRGRIIINTGTTQAGKFFGGKAHQRLLLDDWQRELHATGWWMRYVRCWPKRGGLALTAPSTDVIDSHWEFLGYFYRPESKPFLGSRRVGGAEGWALDGVWDGIHGEASAGGTHVAAYPIEIPRRNVLLFSDRGKVVLDPFAGAGTTMIAAEMLGRRGAMIEIDPAYCDVIRQRYADVVGDPSFAPR